MSAWAPRSENKATIDTPHGLRTCFEARVPGPGKQPLVARFSGIPLARRKDAILIDHAPKPVPHPTKELIIRLRRAGASSANNPGRCTCTKSANSHSSAAQMLEGMPEPEDLRRTQAHGQTVITVGSWVIACFDPADLGMRNITVLTLTEALSFTGRRMSQVMGLTPEYVSELRGRAHREGSAGTICARVRGGLHERLTTVLQSTAPTWGSIAVRSGEHGVAHLAYHRSWCGTSASAPCLQ